MGRQGTPQKSITKNGQLRKLSSSMGFTKFRLTPRGKLRSKKKFTAKLSEDQAERFGFTPPRKKVPVQSTTKRKEKLDFKVLARAWFEKKGHVARNGNYSIGSIEKFIGAHRKYRLVNANNGWHWVNKMKNEQTEHYKLKDADLLEVVQDVLDDRKRQGPDGNGARKVTTKDLKSKIQAKYKEKVDAMSKRDKKAYLYQPLHEKTVKKYIQWIEKQNIIEFFQRSRKVLRRRLHSEQDLRSIISLIALIDNITRLPTTDPAYKKTKGRIPFNLLFNIDSTTFIFDADLKNMTEGTWDAVGTTDHPIVKDKERTPFGLRQTVITNGTGVKHHVVALKVPSKFLEGGFHSFKAPGRDNCLIIVTNGKYDERYFEHQLEEQLGPMLKKEREKVKELFQLNCDIEELNAAIVVDGERPSLKSLMNAVGVSGNAMTSQKAVEDMLDELAQVAENEGKSSHLSAPAASMEEEHIVEEATHIPFTLKNMLLGKFGAKCSGTQQWLDLSPYFMNGKWFLRYQYTKEVDDPKIWTASHPFFAELTFLKTQLQKSTSKEPKVTNKQLKLPPMQAKKFALAISLAMRAAESYGTAEQLVKGYKKGQVQEIMDKEYGKVFAFMDLEWASRDEEFQKRLIEEIVPACIKAMREHKGQIPESVFTELGVPKIAKQLEQELKNLRYGNDIIDLIRKRALLVRDDIMEEQLYDLKATWKKAKKKKATIASLTAEKKELKTQLKEQKAEFKSKEKALKDEVKALKKQLQGITKEKKALESLVAKNNSGKTQMKKKAAKRKNMADQEDEPAAFKAPYLPNKRGKITA